MKKKLYQMLVVGMTAGMLFSTSAVSAYAEDGTKDIITIGVDSDWNDISPFGTMSTMRTAVRYNFYEYMAVRKDFGCSLEDMVLECAKEINKVDDLTYDVTMYDYIKDSEGNPITAKDYAWSAMTMKEKGNYEKLTSYLESVEAIDDYTVEIKLSDNPLGTIEYILNIVPVISQAAYESTSDEMSSKPVTTGPYSVEEMVPGSTLTLVKNENYWQTDDKKSIMATTNVDKIVYKVVTESTQMATALQTGDVDMVQYMDTAMLPTFYMNGEAVPGFKVEELSSNMMFSLLPNMDEVSVVSQSAALREAIYYAIDAESCVQSACSGYGQALSAMANPLSGDFVDAWNERDYYSYNVETAKEKLEESGVDVSGTTLKLLTQPAMNLDKVAVVIQAELAEIGINVEIVNVEDALYQTYKTDPTQYDLILDIKGTDDYVTFPWSLLFDNRSFGTGASINGIVDDELQTRLETALDPDTHDETTVSAFEDYLEENAYAYGLYTKGLYVVAKDDVVDTLDYLQGSYILPGLCTY